MQTLDLPCILADARNGETDRRAGDRNDRERLRLELIDPLLQDAILNREETEGGIRGRRSEAKIANPAGRIMMLDLPSSGPPRNSEAGREHLLSADL